jgi:hypothetical protein
VEVYDAALHRPLFGFYSYEPHIELAFHCRNWVTTQIQPIAPLCGCFDPSTLYQDALYNVSDAVWGPRKTQVESRICHDLAGTVPPPPPYDSSTHKHIPGEKRLALEDGSESVWGEQEWMVKRSFPTQNVKTSRLIL